MSPKRKTRGFGDIYAHRRGGKVVGYRACVYIRGRKTWSPVCPTEALARPHLEQLRKRKVDVESGAADAGRVTDETLTYAALAPLLRDEWKAGARRVLTERTHASYLLQLDAVLETWKNRRVAYTRDVDVRAYVADLRESGASTSTIRHRLDRLAQLHRIAVEHGYLPAPPCAVRRPRMVTRSPRPAASDAEYLALLAAAKKLDPRAVAALRLAGDAGLRRGEIPRLRGEDVRLDLEVIRVPVRDEADRTKSGAHRDVPIATPELADALRALNPMVGLSLLPGIESPGGLDHLMSTVWEAAGLGDDPQLHQLRHRWATRLLDAGEPPARVMLWGGWRDMRTMMRYSHASGEPTNRARAALKTPEQDTGSTPSISAVIPIRPARPRRTTT